MPTRVLICDDSALARKMIARALPPSLAEHLCFAASGDEALQIIRSQTIDLLLLDLNMPGLTGYDVLNVIQQQDLPVFTIVISGDIQPDAYQQVMQSGALDFIRKPLDTEKLLSILHDYGLLARTAESSVQSGADTQQSDLAAVSFEESLQEVFNIAMGQAGSSLSKVLNTFIDLPVPRVRRVKSTRLTSILSDTAQRSLSAVVQGFSGNGIRGEAMLLLDDTSAPQLQQHYPLTEHSADAALEILMDLATILTGTCLQGLSEQLDIQLTCANPVVLGRHQSLEHMLSNVQAQDLLSVELNYKMYQGDVECDLIFLFTEDATVPLRDRLELLT
ncbi:response regulator [Aliidiomarina sp. Khilg15.8]